MYTQTETQPDNTGHLISRRSSLIIFLILFLGYSLFIWFTYTKTDEEMRKDLLLHAMIASKSLDYENLRNLSGSAEDINNPAYQSTKQKLIEIKATDPKHKFLYLLGQGSDGHLFFFVDSEEPETEGYSPPGEFYEAASPENDAYFAQTEPFTEGPLTDTYGSWVSALVPMIDPETKKTLAFFGMDVTAQSWKMAVA